MQGQQVMGQAGCKTNEELFVLLSSGDRSCSWLDLITNLSDREVDLRKRILQICFSQIIPSLEQPFLLLDFLVDSCDLGGVCSILALKSLFLLIQKFNLDFPSFYDQLYKVLDRDVLHTKYRELVFDLLETALASSHLPAYLVCAFVKRLSRLALGAPTAAIMWIVPFSYNLLKQHPACSSLLHQPDGNNLLSGELDPYDWDASLQECNAIKSCLWELVALRDHFYFKLSLKSKILSQRPTKSFFNLEEHRAFSIDQFMQTELTKPLKHPAPVRIEKGDLF